MDTGYKRYFGRATGRVQGVGFRFFVQQNAMELGLTGWVKNMEDGSVTMEVQGSAEDLQVLEKRLKHGNGFIAVRTLSVEPKGILAHEKDFRILY